jgi:hypothetical protein
MSRAFPIACLTLGLLASPARADDANRYEIIVVPSAAGDGKSETMLIDRQTGKTWLRAAEFEPTTFAVKDTYWVPRPRKTSRSCRRTEAAGEAHCRERGAGAS